MAIGDVIDGDDLDVRIAQRGAHDVPADAAESVDAYFDGHTSSVGMFGTAAGSLERNDRSAEHKMLWAAWSKVNAEPCVDNVWSLFRVLLDFGYAVAAEANEDGF